MLDWHRARKSNGIADAISRRPYSPVVAAYDKPRVQTERMWELQKQNPTLADIINYLEQDKLVKRGFLAYTGEIGFGL